MGADPQEMLWHNWEHCHCRAAEAEPGYLKKIEELESSAKTRIVILPLFDEDKQPCKAARREKVTCIFKRFFESFDAFKKFDDEDYESFMNNGTNHREMITHDGTKCIARDDEKEEWIVDVSSLKEIQDILWETDGCLDVSEYFEYKDILFTIHIDTID